MKATGDKYKFFDLNRCSATRLKRIHEKEVK